jgi:hypothetical protein
MKKILFIIIAIISLASTCRSDEPVQTKTVEGYVKQIDEVGSTIVVQISLDAISFFVPDSAKIIQGSEAISIGDIEINDPLTIEYFKNANDQNEATKITDNNLANE